MSWIHSFIPQIRGWHSIHGSCLLLERPTVSNRILKKTQYMLVNYWIFFFKCKNTQCKFKRNAKYYLLLHRYKKPEHEPPVLINVRSPLNTLCIRWRWFTGYQLTTYKTDFQWEEVTEFTVWRQICHRPTFSGHKLSRRLFGPYLHQICVLVPGSFYQTTASWLSLFTNTHTHRPQQPWSHSDNHRPTNYFHFSVKGEHV